MITLANSLAERRFAVHCVLWDESGPFRFAVGEGACSAPSFEKSLKLVFGFARFLRTYQPEIVISALFVANIIAAIAKATSRSRTHLILTEHVPTRTYLQNEPRLLRQFCIPLLMRITYSLAQDVVLYPKEPRSRWPRQSERIRPSE